MTAIERHWRPWRALTGLGLVLAAVVAALFWQTRQSYLTTLPVTHGVVIDAQAARFSCLAIACPQPGGTTGPTVLGNPAAHRYPDCHQSYARNPWDLIAYQGRLYVGLGDAGNEGPSANAGPVPVYTYTPETGAFTQETTLPEEQLDRFYQFDSELWVPGADPRQSWRLGNLYRRAATGTWTRLRTLPRTIHTLALAREGRRWFAGVSVTEAVPAGTGTDPARAGSAVAISDDGGRHWRLDTLGGQRIFDFLEVGGQWYAADIFPGPGVARWLVREGRQALHSPLYEYVPEQGFARRTDLSAPVIFPDTPLAGRRAAVVERALAWGSSAAYLGVFAFKSGEWPERGLYLARDLRPGRVLVRRLPLPAGALAWDLRQEAGRLQVLFGIPQPDGQWENRVWSTTDARHWTELAGFKASTFARSFERLGDAFYVGLGSLLPPPAGPCSTAADATGTWLRVPLGRGDSRTLTKPAPRE